MTINEWLTHLLADDDPNPMLCPNCNGDGWVDPPADDNVGPCTCGVCGGRKVLAGPEECMHAVVASLRFYRFNPGQGHERDLQAQVLKVLTEDQPRANWVREHKVACGRLDLWSPAWGIGIETKVGADTFDQVMKQIAAYLQLAEVLGILVVTRRHVLRSLPSVVHGKPVLVYWIGANL
jgi:hypothetical protein